MKLLLIIAMLLVGLSSKLFLMLARGGQLDVATRPILVQFVGALMLPTQVGLVIVGFFFFVWWQWLSIIAFSLIVFSNLFNPNRQVWLYIAEPFINAIAIAITVAAWLTYFALI